MKTSLPRKKQLFLLLELMVALSLVACCALPLIRTPYVYIMKQTKSLQTVQLHLEAEKTLGEIKEKFYTNEIDWKEIEGLEKKPLVLMQEPVTLPGLATTYSKTCSLKSAKIQEGKNEEIWAKVIIEVSYTLPKSKKPDLKLSHTLTLCQKEIPQETNPQITQ